MKISRNSPIAVRILPVVLLAAVLLGCSRAELSPLADESVILAFGDSLTAGVGAGPGQAYPDVLSELSGLQVVNAGVSGETTAGGRQRLPSALDSHAPDLLILMEGGNDILRSRKPQTIRANLAAMIEMARAVGVQVVLVGVPDRMLFASSASLYGELAEQYQLPLIDGPLASLLRDDDYKSDPIHLNARGYRRLAEELHRALVEHGALL